MLYEEHGAFLPVCAEATRAQALAAAAIPGAGGAAIATVLGYVFMNVYSVIIICRKSRMLSVNIREARTSAENIAQIFSVGIPAAVTNILQSVSAVFVNQFLLPYGDDRIAAMGIALKVAMAGNMILIGLAYGGVPLFGYYYGAARREKFHELLRCSMRLICAVASSAALAVTRFDRSYDAEVIPF